MTFELACKLTTTLSSESMTVVIHFYNCYWIWD
jgi:hypothetical protein